MIEEVGELFPVGTRSTGEEVPESDPQPGRRTFGIFYTFSPKPMAISRKICLTSDFRQMGTRINIPATM